jgi:hypothetical protein
MTYTGRKYLSTPGKINFQTGYVNGVGEGAAMP